MNHLMKFEELFDGKNRQKDKFLSRLFGIFSEDIVRIWCRDERAPYSDLGRPSIYVPGRKRPYTLDFTFESRHDSCVYIGEMKCELEYQNYKFLTLNSGLPIERHKAKPAFALLLELAKKPGEKTVKVNSEKKTIQGAMLVWGAYSEGGYSDAKKNFFFHEVLSMENIITNLISWKNTEYQDFIQEKAKWCQGLFTGLRTLPRQA